MCTPRTAAFGPALGYDVAVATRDTLRSLFDAARTSKRLDELSTARVIGKVAEQVHSAQQKAGAGKAIGPITPSGIGLETSGSVKLALDDRGPSLGYSAPEQASGGAGDRRSDVFSLGVVMWEALTAQRLFEAMNDAAVKAAIAEREIKQPTELNANIPAELSAICMKALARNPAERYGSLKAMGVEIEEFLGEAGYPDSNDKIAAHLRELARPEEPAPAKTPALPPIEQVAAFAPPVVAAPTPAPAPIAAPAPKPVAPTPVAAAPVAAAPVAAVAAPTPPKPPVTPDNPKMTLMAAAPPPPTPPKDTIPDGQIAASMREEALPHPAAVVALPRPRAGTDGGRGDVLAGWGWGTDSHEAIGDDEDFHPHHGNRKVLMYVIGGGIAAAMIVTIIAVGFGGSKNEAKKKPAPQAALTEGSASGSAMGSADLAMATTGSAPAAEPAPAAAAVPTPEPVTVAIDAAEQPAPEPPQVATEPPKTEPPKTEPPKTEPPKTEPPKTEPPKTEPPKVAKTEPPKTETPKPPKSDTPKPKAEKVAAKSSKGTLADPFAAKTRPDKTPKKDTSTPKVDVETAYRVGLQQFARGDTNGALASLRTSLASNPNYPPTWRGLGLVFEKLGEKEQARAAFKRYLQLSPGASDAEQIKNRLERLGS
jgi:outer membrane biosynthesis protein TonB